TVEFNLDTLLDKICAPIFIVMIAMIIGRFLWRVCFFGASVRTEKNLRKEMFEHACKLSQNYYQVNRVGNLMALFTNDLETVEECFGWGLMMFLDAILLGGLSLYNMLKVQPLLTLFCLIPMVFLLFIGVILNKYMMKKWDYRQQVYSEISDFSQESFSGIAVIKAFVKEAKELWNFNKLNDKNETANVDFVKMAMLLRVSVTLFVESVICVILGVGGYLVYNGDILAESLLEFIGYFTAIVWPIMAISELVDMHSRGKTSLNRISELLDAEVDVKDEYGAEDIGEVAGRIEFKNLTFRYPAGNRDVLKNVSFTVEAGERVGLVGRIGAGKTTVADLILRVYNVERGCLFIDGKDVNDVTIESLRRNVAYVPQDNFLFSDTIEENISFASEVDTEKVMAAAENACVARDIEEFTDGYKTVLGERGVTVSGGQKQRISMARAFMKNAAILIMDDSVSAVDTETEKTILDNLERNRKNKTTILIAHRISTVENMDKIIFLKHGEVADVGTHKELLARCPDYANIVALQKLEEKEDA
ncbi:MAG: ABC transporter ATP-binding protein, partial [Clostridia bacterium]|nr:ABC transporter ATP-binding protein [Clostridia bacterium]